MKDFNLIETLEDFRNILTPAIKNDPGQINPKEFLLSEIIQFSN